MGKPNYTVDQKENRITFLDNRFYLSQKGNYWPSSTTILDAYPKGYGFMEWLKKNGEDSDTIRDEAGERGTRVHDLTERYDNGEEVSLLNAGGFLNLRMSEWNMFERYIEFRQKHDTNVIANELSLCSDKLKFGGTIDRVIEVNQERLLMDIKTSNFLSKHFWLQLASYRELLEKCERMTVDGIAILWLNAKTRGDGRAGAIQGKGWQLLVCRDAKEIDQYYRLFKHTHALWLEENEGMKPREFSYKIKHKL
jgi:hypothetical protein